MDPKRLEEVMNKVCSNNLAEIEKSFQDQEKSLSEQFEFILRSIPEELLSRKLSSFDIPGNDFLKMIDEEIVKYDLHCGGKRPLCRKNDGELILFCKFWKS